MKRAKPKSPIPKSPLRRPGQSLQKRLIESCIGPIYFMVLPPILYIGILMGSWKNFPHWIGIVIVVFFLVIYEMMVYCIYNRFLKAKIENIRLGYEGEVYVGQQLDEMRSFGWKVLHDFQTGRGNIDHIIIAPQGVFTLETKAVRRYEDETTIHYDCVDVATEKRKLCSPVKQAKGEAKFLADFIKEKLTMHLFVQPIVTYPGWKYEYCGRKTLDECEVWICSIPGLPSVINRRPILLNQEEYHRIYNFLASENRTKSWKV